MMPFKSKYIDKEKKRMKHPPSLKTKLKPWIMVTLALLLQTGVLFTAGTEAVA